MFFDLRTCDSAYRFILDCLNMMPDEFITEFAIESESNFEFFWERNIQRIQTIDISQLRILAFHVLGSLDCCEEIKKNGLWNLQMVLSGDTILSRILKEHGIRFDITNKLLYAGSKKYDIDYEHYRGKHFLTGADKVLDRIAHRVFYDYCVNGFLVNDDVFNYGTRIHERPEFLMALSDLLPDAKKIEQCWETHAESYRVDFFVNKEQVHRFNFELDEHRDPPYEGWYDLDDDMKTKKWMLSHAIDRANDNITELFLYIKDELIVPPDQIISCSTI
ncbi:MAG TPA: hypothetical protein IAA57_12120 [Candidatus Pullilachnospira intestinigallinarum]|nr:hypothetical protein [Candidatus Pullilachnospira intestinigallinarum]